VKEANILLDSALVSNAAAAETLGRLDYQDYAHMFSTVLKKDGDDKEARRVSDKASQMIDRLDGADDHGKRLHKTAA
jgi:hypothetical protein